MTTVPSVYVEHPAWQKIIEQDWNTGRELGVALLGHIEDGGKVVVTEASVNPSGPQGRDYTRYDWNHHIHQQRFRRIGNYTRPTDPILPSPFETLIVGTLHNHPDTVGRTSCSDEDSEQFKEGARVFERNFAGLVLTASAEIWRGGYPDGYVFDPPFLSAWVATPGGDLWTTTCTIEPFWQWTFRDEQHRLREEAIARGDTIT